MKFNLNTPVPQPLPKECAKAARILQSFVDTRNHGLDGFIPRSVLQHAKGFAIFSVFKAGFVFSARAGSGVVIARLADGSWSAPSAIGTAGMGFGGQIGAEVTDFLIILNSHAAVKSFMAAGSLTLGGNMSVAVGPLGRNGEASGALGTSGAVATMYSYSKTKGLFGGVSIEGSIIVERQDANALAYRSDVTAKMLLSGAISPPDWSNELIRTLDNCTGMPGGQKWVYDGTVGRQIEGYAFGGMANPVSDPPRRKKNRSLPSFPPATWGKSKDSGSYFTSVQDDNIAPQKTSPMDDVTLPNNSNFNSPEFPTRFTSSFASDTKDLTSNRDRLTFATESDTARSLHIRSQSQSLQSSRPPNPFLEHRPRSEMDTFSHSMSPTSDAAPISHFTQNASPATSPQSHKGVARAIALFNFNAIEPGDLPFSRGDVIVVTEMSDTTDDWWTGSLNGRRGIFPANFVELTYS